MNKRIVVLLMIFTLTATACNGTFQLQQDQDFNYLSVTLPERDVVTIVQNILTSSDSQLSNVQADLRAGEIFVMADATTANGALIPGNLTFRAWAQDGNLQLSVTSFSFGQMTAQQAGIDAFNRRLADGLSRAAANSQSQSEITDITVTDTAFSITIRAPRRK